MVSSGSPAMLAVRRFGASALRRFGASANVAATTPVGNTAGRLRRHSPGKADLPPGFHSPGRADLPPVAPSPAAYPATTEAIATGGSHAMRGELQVEAPR